MAVHHGHLYLSIGERGQRDNAQDLASHAGSVVRFHLDGRIPADNPVFTGGAPGLFTKGHRNPQGMAVHPATGDIWVNEHGPKGGDEINILSAGEIMAGRSPVLVKNISVGRSGTGSAS